MPVHAAHLDHRLAWLGRFRAALASREHEVTTVIESELAKPRWEAVTAEIMPVLAAARWHERHARRVLRPRRVPGGGIIALGQRHHVERLPLGHVAIIATWNYPVGLLGVQLLQAITAGNRVTVKPSEHAPRSQALLLDIARAAGLTNDDLTVTEPTREAGAALLKSHAFDHVVFTGSTDIGRAIAEVLAPTLTPSTLELSGRDSALVLEDADPRLAAASIWFGVTMNGGQTCISPKRALVHRRVYPEFLRQLGLLAAASAPRRLINDHAARTASDQLRRALELGGRALTGVFEPADGPRLRPQAIVDCPPHADLVDGRNFAPTLAVVPCDTEDAMLAIHDRCNQHLATAVFTRSPGRARQRLLHRLRAGSVSFNDCVIPTGHPGSAIGGVGASGWGRSQGEEGLLHLTRPVSVSITSPVIRVPTTAPAPEQAAKMIAWSMRLFGAAPISKPPAPTQGPRTSTALPHAPTHTTNPSPTR